MLGIRENAPFILLETPNEGDLPDVVMGRGAFLELAALTASGTEPVDRFCSYFFGVPSKLWIGDTDELQQLEQIWTP